MFKKIISLVVGMCIICIPISVNAEGENTDSNGSNYKEIYIIEEETNTDSNNDSSKEEVKDNTQDKTEKEKNKKENKKENKKDEKKETKKEDTKKEDTKKEDKKSSDSKDDSNGNTKDEYSSKNESTAAYRGLIAYYDPELSTVLRYPLTRTGSLSTYFGSIDSVHSTPHKGIDIAIASGTPIVACESGTVVRASWYGGYGNCVDIQHEDGSMTRYGHMNEINVQRGDKVLRGQQIGKVGSTGHSTGPHVHLEYYEPGSSSPIDPLQLVRKVTDEYNYADVKFTFVNKENVTNETSLKDLNIEDIYFQLNETFIPEIKKGKTVIDIDKFYENGLINSEDLNITCSEKCKITFKDHKIILDKEITQSKIQIIIPSNKFTTMAIPVSIEDNINFTTENVLYEYSPLFNISIDLNNEDIEKGNIIVEVNDQILDDSYFDYINNKLVLYYSCLNVKKINITLNNIERNVKNVNEDNNINNIINWIESDDINIIKFNSFIDNCYYIKSLTDNEVSLTPLNYNRYNNDTDKSSILLDNQTSDGYISIPTELDTNNIKFDSSTDKYIEDKDINIQNKTYNTFIYGEKLNILDKKKVKEGYKEVNFNIIDNYKDAEYNYFIISYEVEGIGGYFGIKIKN